MFANAAFPPQVYAFPSVLLRQKDAQEHHIGNKMPTMMSKGNTLNQMIGRSDDQMMECGGGVGHYLIV